MQATKVLSAEHQRHNIEEGARRLQEQTVHNFTTNASAIAWVKKQRKARFHIAVHAHGMVWACSLIKVSKPALIKFMEQTSERVAYTRFNWRISHIPGAPFPFETPLNDKLTATICIHPVFVDQRNRETSENPKGNK